MKRLFFLLVLINISYAQTYEDIPVNTGWNLIGALEDGPTVNIISTRPPGIIISSFFGYNNQYLAEDTLARGKGYWVKVNQPGLVIIKIPIQTFGPCNGVSTVDYEGKTYNTVAIGNQCWLRENLDVGTMIPSSQNPANNGTIEKYCYNNDSVNCLLYGGLYHWNEAMQYSNIPPFQGICPSGWHIPTSPEFSVLSTEVNYNGNVLKSVGQGAGGGAGTNTTGFSGLLTGWWDDFYSVFVQSGIVTSFWNSTEYVFDYAGYWQLIYYSDLFDGFNGTKEAGFSVRCIKD